MRPRYDRLRPPPSPLAARPGRIPHGVVEVPSVVVPLPPLLPQFQMSQWSLVRRAVALCVATHALANAQGVGCGRGNSFAASAGINQSDRADASIAPAQFEGRGPVATLSGEMNARGACVTAFVTGGVRSLTPVAGTFGRERLIDGYADIEGLAPVFTSSRAMLSLGVAAQTSIAGTTHTFTDPNATTSTFRLGVLSLGPAVRATYAAPHFRLSGGLTVGVASLVDHSYAAVWAQDLSPSLRFAWLNTLRSASASIDIERPITRAISARIGYRVYGLRFDDARDVRTLSQSLNFGLSLTRGSERR